MKRLLAAILTLALGTLGVRAETVHVAVAANFAGVAEELAPLFTAAAGHEVTYSFGATGQLYTQALQGAPYEILLAADDERPGRAVADGIGVDGSVFTYAVGALALYSASLDLSDGAAVLTGGGFDTVAIADPETAPYGRAAIETLTALGLLDAVTPKIVTGQSITQTLQFVETGNAELGFVSLSQVLGKEGVWLVSEALYQPIRQDAVLLVNGKDRPAATSFMSFLRSAEAVQVIEAAGYTVP